MFIKHFRVMPVINLLEAVRKSFCPHGVSPENMRGKNVLAAVSGGIDSMVMLDVLSKLSDVLGFVLYVITVNHNIRPEEETSGDVELVKKACDTYGIPCTVHVLRRGLVNEVSSIRGKGIEEAARFLRYEAFEEEARKIGAEVVCIAHNRNDRLETILQRFLQGAGILSASGMRQSRDMYIRPLFDVSRQEIEDYAVENGVKYRTDATNADNSYFRNRIRNKLIPFLNEIEPGWDSAVIHGAEKNIIAADDINKAINGKSWTRDGDSVLRMRAADFENCAFTARTALIYNGLSLLKCPKRIPYSMIASFSDGARKVTGAGVVMERKSDFVFLSSCGAYGNEAGDSGFFVFVSSPGRYVVGNEPVTVREVGGDGTELYVAENDDGCVSGLFRLPVVIRSGIPSDNFRTANGEKKLLSKIFSEWRVPAGEKRLIPVFEDDENRGVWGSLYGFPDWFVKIDCEKHTSKMINGDKNE